jgi:hypothetical protein
LTHIKNPKSPFYGPWVKFKFREMLEAVQREVEGAALEEFEVFEGVEEVGALKAEP